MINKKWAVKYAFSCQDFITIKYRIFLWYFLFPLVLTIVFVPELLSALQTDFLSQNKSCQSGLSTLSTEIFPLYYEPGTLRCFQSPCPGVPREDDLLWCRGIVRGVESLNTTHHTALLLAIKIQPREFSLHHHTSFLVLTE